MKKLVLLILILFVTSPPVFGRDVMIIFDFSGSVVNKNNKDSLLAGVSSTIQNLMEGNNTGLSGWWEGEMDEWEKMTLTPGDKLVMIAFGYPHSYIENAQCGDEPEFFPMQQIVIAESDVIPIHEQITTFFSTTFEINTPKYKKGKLDDYSFSDLARWQAWNHWRQEGRPEGYYEIFIWDKKPDEPDSYDCEDTIKKREIDFEKSTSTNLLSTLKGVGINKKLLMHLREVTPKELDAFLLKKKPDEPMCPSFDRLVDGVCYACPINHEEMLDGTCQKCGNSQYWREGKCLRCSKGFTINEERTGCQCPSGNIIDNACYDCPVDQELSAEACVACPAFKFWQNGKCLSCQNGFKIDNEREGCFCPSGNQDGERCFDCPVGEEFVNNTCRQCPANTIVIAGGCQTCTNGTTPTDDKTECFCQSGYEIKGVCQPCARGLTLLDGECGQDRNILLIGLLILAGLVILAGAVWGARRQRERRRKMMRASEARFTQNL